jgi:hypothetical protein
LTRPEPCPFRPQKARYGTALLSGAGFVEAIRILGGQIFLFWANGPTTKIALSFGRYATILLEYFFISNS